MRFTSSALVGMALAFGSAGALAQDGGGLKVRGFIGIGFLGGGEKLAAVQVTSNFGGTSTQSVRAGGDFDLRGGIELGFLPQWSAQATIGRASSGVKAENGRATFGSYPLEVLGHYAFAEGFRVGLGVRVPLSAEYKEGGAAGNTLVKFSDSVSPVLEIEWVSRGGYALKLRGTKEVYKVKNTSIKVDGSAVGFYAGYYF
jgi:hypothetical protein